MAEHTVKGPRGDIKVETVGNNVIRVTDYNNTTTLAKVRK